MFQRIKSFCLDYVHAHRVTYYVISLLFCVGLAFGVVLSMFLSDMRQDEIEDFVRLFCRSSHSGGADTFIYSLSCYFKTAFILWLCSVSALLIPVAGFVVAAEGFGIGFTLGSLTKIFGLKGFVLSFASVFSGAVIAVPVIIHLACCSVYYALEKSRRPHIASDKKVFIRFCITTVFCMLLLLCSALIDGYISTVFVRNISGSF